MALRPTRAVKSHRNHGQMSPELRSSVARIAVKCIGIRSLVPGCPGIPVNVTGSLVFGIQ